MWNRIIHNLIQKDIELKMEE